MELHEWAQFDFLLNTAAERFVERLVQRTGGLEEGLAALRRDPQGESVWLDEFIRAVLRDFLLDGQGGAGDPTGAVGASGMTADPLDAAARRVDNAVDRVGLLDPAERTVAPALKSAAEEFHAQGLRTIVRRLLDDADGRRLLFELVDDPGICALLLMHGLVRADPATLAVQALAEVRPHLESRCRSPRWCRSAAFGCVREPRRRRRSSIPPAEPPDAPPGWTAPALALDQAPAT
jgi:hypothetical protein